MLTPAPPDVPVMDVSVDQAGYALQARMLDSVRATLDATRVQPATPEAQANVILQLSTAAQQLITN
jgi:hypothetical protein